MSERLNPRVADLSSWKVKTRSALGGRCDSDSCRHRPREPALLSSDAFREQHSDADRRTSGSVDVVLLLDRADSDRPVVAAAGPRRSSPSRSPRSQLGNRKQCMAMLLLLGDAAPALQQHGRRQN